MSFVLREMVDSKLDELLREDIVTGQTSDEDPRPDKIVLGQIMIYLKYLGPGQFTILGPTGVTNVPNDQWKTAQNY